MAKKNWIYIKRGLSEDPKHRARMGECIWLYMHIIDRADWETGIAYDWKDEAEAVDMVIPLRTLREQRRKLDEMGYITCKQHQYSQDIIIRRWINPRDYSGKVINQGDAPMEPQDYIQGDTQGYTQGSSQDVTPTSDSKSKVKSQQKTAPTFDFENMTVAEAYKVPALKLYKEATGYMPGSLLWETVHNAITENHLTKDQIKAAAVAWQGRGYKPSNVAGILEWAVNGIPQNGNGSKPAAAPAIDETRVQETQKMLAEKMSGNFVPRPDNVQRPRIGRSDQ